MPHEAIYMPESKTVRFAIYPDGIQGARILAQISEHALCTVFRAENSASDLIAKYKENFVRIQNAALAKHARAPQLAICLRTSDFGAVGRSSQSDFSQ